jgi:hypothetical protein
MTDPDLVFDMDPRNVQRVEQWIAARWPGAVAAKSADGARLSWTLDGRPGGIDSVVATESFLTLSAPAVERLLEDAVTVCELQPEGGSRCYLLLATDGPRAVRDQ